MKAYYEKVREENRTLYFNISGVEDYPLHFHANIEICIMLKGSCEVVCNEKSYVLKENMLAFFDSYSFHSYKKLGSSKCCTLIIPSKYLSQYRSIYQKKIVVSPIISSKTLCKKLLTICDLLNENPSEQIKSEIINLLLLLISEKIEFSRGGESGENELLHKTLKYIHTHYRESINSNSIAKALGYSREHISRVFHRFIQQSIPDYINSLRLEYVEQNREKSKLASVIMEAGFGSFQTYYRAKRK